MMPDGYPADSITGMALHLLRNVSRLRQHPDAGIAVHEITRAATRAQRAIDRPPDLAYLGTCETCHTGIYATPYASWAACACGAKYEVAARRTQLLILAQDILGTAAEISRALTSLGRPVTPSAITRWVQAGRLTYRGHDSTGRRLLRLGDIAELAAQRTVKAGG